MQITSRLRYKERNKKLTSIFPTCPHLLALIAGIPKNNEPVLSRGMRVLHPTNNGEKPAGKKEEKVWIQFVKGFRAVTTPGEKI